MGLIGETAARHDLNRWHPFVLAIVFHDRRLAWVLVEHVDVNFREDIDILRFAFVNVFR